MSEYRHINSTIDLLKTRKSPMEIIHDLLSFLWYKIIQKTTNYSLTTCGVSSPVNKELGTM